MDIQVLIDLGIDYQDAVNRFLGNESMYQKFLVSFLEDNTMEKVKQSLLINDYAQLSKDLHTLKGVSGNLSLMPLYNQCIIASSALKANSTEEIALAIEGVVKSYDAIIAAIKG